MKDMKKAGILVSPSFITKLASKSKVERGLIVKIFEDLKTGGVEITQEILSNQIKWVNEEEIKTFEDYQSKLRTIIEEVQTKAESEPVNDKELRKKLGYTNSDWKQVKIIESQIKDNLRKLVVELVASNLASPNKLTQENFLENDTYKKLDTMWRNFARNYVIPKYPRININTSIRARVTNMFKNTVEKTIIASNVKLEDMLVDNAVIQAKEANSQKKEIMEKAISEGHTIVSDDIIKETSSEGDRDLV